MDIVTKILQALALAGSETPAFIALFNIVKESLGSDDLAALEARMAEMDKIADDQHSRAQGRE